MQTKQQRVKAFVSFKHHFIPGEIWDVVQKFILGFLVKLGTRFLFFCLYKTVNVMSNKYCSSICGFLYTAVNVQISTHMEFVKSEFLVSIFHFCRRHTRESGLHLSQC